MRFPNPITSLRMTLHRRRVSHVLKYLEKDKDQRLSDFIQRKSRVIHPDTEGARKEAPLPIPLPKESFAAIES